MDKVVIMQWSSVLGVVGMRFTAEEPVWTRRRCVPALNPAILKKDEELRRAMAEEEDIETAELKKIPRG